ncbi:hypothetical protein FQR65_LT16077 [Abscondita terminalis]|nr:hypothetical protein FQR65_LT16077 [Abscondita terminalis]
MSDCINDLSMDIATPRNVFFSGFYKRSFAYSDIKKRLPRILTELTDLLVAHKGKIIEDYGLDARDELEIVIGEISKLKCEIETNKPMRNIMDDASDAALYNSYLAEQMNTTYFTSVSLFAACYAYRRIREIFNLTQSLCGYDPFKILKEEAHLTSRTAMVELSRYLISIFGKNSENNEQEFNKLLKLNLWGNKCDLSFSAGVVENACNPANNLEVNIISNQSSEIWSAVTDSNSPIIDIVLDNTGYELFTDLCLADFFITKKLAQKIRIYVKSIPWFVSDVTKSDFDWTLQELMKSDVSELNKLGKRWSKYVQDGIWVVVDNKFFTLPIDYSYMAKEGVDLYKQFAEAKLVIFKGDLNYRKLFGEKNWNPRTSLEDGLQGFMPSKLAILRTIKCQLVCGLEAGIAEAISEKFPDWEESGNYGVIQFCDKIKVVT